MRRTTWFTALVACVTAAAAALLTGLATTAASAESNGGVRVMPLGDSITDGLTVAGGYRIELWKRLVAGHYTVDFVGANSNGPAELGDHDHAGYSGWRIDQIDAQIVGWLRTYQPRTIMLQIGTNDIAQGYDVANAPNRLSTLLDHILTASPNVELFVASLTPLSTASWETSVRTFNAAIPGIVTAKSNAGYHTHFVDIHASITTSDLADGVHPNATGYTKMGDTWYAALTSVPSSLENGTPTTGPTTGPTTSPTVSPTRSPTVSPTVPTTAPGGRSCVASYRVASQWTGGFQGEFTVTAGTGAISGWTVGWTFGAGQTVTQSWNATVSGGGGGYTATNMSYNGALGAGASTTFGFIGSGAASPSPTATCTAR